MRGYVPDLEQISLTEIKRRGGNATGLGEIDPVEAAGVKRTLTYTENNPFQNAQFKKFQARKSTGFGFPLRMEFRHWTPAQARLLNNRIQSLEF
jgi:hypothetical protein